MFATLCLTSLCHRFLSMSALNFDLFLDVLCLGMVLVSASNCPYKECPCSQDSVSCDARNLSSIPALVGSGAGLGILNFQGNTISRVLAGSLPANLTELDLYKNPLVSIDIHAFDQSSNTLLSLAMSEAKFTRIPDAVSHLRTLNSFNLMDTPVQDWNPDAMKVLGPKLLNLYLVNVSLTTWPSWLQYFTNLGELSLDSNFLSSLPQDAFSAMSGKLRSLSISYNNLTAIPSAMAVMPALTSFNLDYNLITDVTWLPKADHLYEISLTHNRISNAQHFSGALRPLASIMFGLNVYSNLLREIPDLSFMSQISVLDLSMNQISNYTAGSLPSDVSEFVLENNNLPLIPKIYSTLKYINSVVMANNRVYLLRASDIPPWVVELQLPGNLITELTESSFPENSKLNSLMLSSNPLAKISDQALANLKELRTLSLENTLLARLPLGLSSLTRLELLELDGCSQLVCTCLEKDLAPWVVSRESSINGNCGDSSIYDFFFILSQSCPS